MRHIFRLLLVVWFSILPFSITAAACFTSRQRRRPRHNFYHSYASSFPSTLVRHPTRHAHLVTFDLDDTLFPVSKVIKDANSKLMKSMNEYGYASVTEESFITTTKLIRSQLNAVITYTDLRKKTIRKEMENDANYQSIIQKMLNDETDKTADDLVLHFYDEWEAERHRSAEYHLYHDAIEMLRELRERFPDVIIGAITNGKGDPLEMKQTLAPYFDFCTSGEDDNVFPGRKPQAGIYQVALETHSRLQRDRNFDSDQLCWFHVGDDLANDVGASALLGAHAIWCCFGDAYCQTGVKSFRVGDSKKGKEPSWSTASEEEVRKRQQLAKDAVNSVSAEISQLSQLPDAISQILNGARRGPPGLVQL